MFIYQALIHGLNRAYYSMAISYRKNDLEQKMLMNVHKKQWAHGLLLERAGVRAAENGRLVEVCGCCLLVRS